MFEYQKYNYSAKPKIEQWHIWCSVIHYENNHTSYHQSVECQKLNVQPIANVMLHFQQVHISTIHQTLYQSMTSNNECSCHNHNRLAVYHHELHNFTYLLFIVVPQDVSNEYWVIIPHIANMMTTLSSSLWLYSQTFLSWVLVVLWQTFSDMEASTFLWSTNIPMSWLQNSLYLGGT